MASANYAYGNTTADAPSGMDGTAVPERRKIMIDKMMKKYGYTKTKENEYGVYYQKREPQNYDHIVCVISKASGRHILQSYDAETIRVPGRAWAVNEGAGVEIPVLLLLWMKAKYLGFKYHWKRTGEGV